MHKDIYMAGQKQVYIFIKCEYQHTSMLSIPGCFLYIFLAFIYIYIFILIFILIFIIILTYFYSFYVFITFYS